MKADLAAGESFIAPFKPFLVLKSYPTAGDPAMHGGPQPHNPTGSSKFLDKIQS